MRDPKPVEGARALLFERLVDDEPLAGRPEPRPFRALDVRALRESVRRELGRLLNTRCPTPARDLLAEERTVVNYGVPDFSALLEHSGQDRGLVASAVGSAIAAFEPRLRRVRVTAEERRAGDFERALLLRIEAELLVGSVAEPVSFPLYVRGRAGETEVHEDQPE